MYGTRRTRKLYPLLLATLFILTCSASVLFAIELPPTWEFELTVGSDTVAYADRMLVDPVDGSIYVVSRVYSEQDFNYRANRIEKVREQGESLWYVDMNVVDLGDDHFESVSVQALHFDSENNLIVVSWDEDYPVEEGETVNALFVTILSPAGVELSQEMVTLPDGYRFGGSGIHDNHLYTAFSSSSGAQTQPPLVQTWSEAGTFLIEDSLELPTDNLWSFSTFIPIDTGTFLVAFNETVAIGGINLNNGRARLYLFGPDGGEMWHHNYDDFDDRSGATLALRVDEDSNIICGYRYSLFASSGARLESETILEKRNLQGELLWEERTSSDDPPYSPSPIYSVTLDDEGNIFTVGTTRYEESPDMLTMRRNSSGDSVWASIYTGPRGWDNGQRITLDHDGIIYSAGASDGDPEVTSYHWDAAIAAYDPVAGEELWTYRYNGRYGADAVDVVPAIAPRTAGGVLMLVNVSMPEGNGAYSVRLSWGDVNAAPETETALLPDHASLDAYPNPFNAQTTISMTLPAAGEVRLELFNLLGQRVMDLGTHHHGAGIHQFSLDATNLASGIYLLRMQTEQGEYATRRITLLR